MAQDFSVTKGMFGVDPGQLADALNMQRQDEALARNAEIAKMTPWQQVGMFGGAAGEQFGRGIVDFGGALAGMDTRPPDVRKARIVSGVLDQLRQQGADFNNPDQFMPALVDGLAQNGLAKEAAELSMQYQPMKQASMKNQYEILAKSAEIQKKLRGIGDVSPKDFTPASMKMFSQTGNYGDLVAAEGSIAAPVLAQRQWTEALDKMRANNVTFDELDPYEQARIYGLGAQVVGAEAAKNIFPGFTSNGSVTVEEAKAIRFAAMMARAEPAILQLEDQGFRFSNNLLQLLSSPALDKEASLLTIMKQFPVSDEEMRAMDAYVNFLSPALYQKTGAAVTVSEFLRDMRGAVPWSWDNEASIREKQQSRKAQLVGTESALTAPGLSAYNRARTQLGMPPSSRTIQGPLDRPNVPNKSATPQTGVRPVSSTTPMPDRNDIPAVQKWLKTATKEEKKAYLQSLMGG